VIRTLDISNWTTPYDLDIVDWDQIAGGSSLAGNVLSRPPKKKSVGQTTIETVNIVGQCDFSQGELASGIQAALGLRPTGVFDDDACTEWYERFGEAPTAAALAEAVGMQCGSAIVPSCPVLDQKKSGELSSMTVLALGGGLAAVAIFALTRLR